MLNFNSDYMEGAHPAILDKLQKINFEKNTGYGNDTYCESAKNKIRKACGVTDAEIYFLAGGTQTNALVIDALLDRCDGVISADTGHIAAHEAGAIESSSHKVLTIPHTDGKISARDVANYTDNFYQDANHQHMVAPGLVYISNPTEYGTLYSYDELQDLYKVCKERDLPLFIDGARLGYGLAARNYDVTLEKLAHSCDVFYIGGTKVGALFGEAVVFTKPGLIRKPVTLIKRHGALLAKGWIMGVQFDTLFTDNLYFNIPANAIDKAEKLKLILKNKGYELYFESPTNQQFIILENSVLEELSKHIGFGFWEKKDNNHTVVRLATSWATTDEQLEQLSELL